MHRLESTKEGKIRAACDRCHDLKNRCVRTGGPDSRCDRCERLNIDCVYRTNLRTGRPRGLSAKNFGENSESCLRTKSRKVHSRQIPRSASSDTTRSAVDSDQNDLETRNTPRHSPDGPTSDAMDLVISPEVVHQAELDWSLDFSPHINADIANDDFSEVLFQDACGDNAQPLQESDAFAFLESESGVRQTARDVETTTDKLLQLQYQLHRFFLKTDQETSMDNPAMNEVLEATKRFLEILQDSVAAQSCLSDPTLALASSVDAPSRSNEPSHSGQSARQKQTSLSYITLLQVLTCYSYVLHALEPVIGTLISQTVESTKETAEYRCSFLNAGLESSSQPALSLGFFNLASQPAMNADVVLYIVLQMIQQLRVSIHMLTSRCRDLTDKTDDRPLSPSATDETRKLHATPINISSQPVVEVISKREESLVERLSCLTIG